MATKQRIATLKGTFAVPGVSKNRRLYTKAHIAGAVHEAQQLIDSGNAPIVAMLTHHGARDPKAGDVTRTAGRITKVGLTPEGHGTFEAELADTTAGHDVAALTTPDKPYLKGVSMASVWKGDVRHVRGPDGDPVETADGFSLKGIDFTHNPGVEGAEIHSAVIYESLEESVFIEPIASLKGSPMPPSLNDQQINEVLRLLKANGTGPQVIAAVSEQYGVAEAVIHAVGRVITEGVPGILSEVRPPSGHPNVDAFAQARAADLVARANRAESNLRSASAQDLEALATLAMPR